MNRIICICIYSTVFNDTTYENIDQSKAYTICFSNELVSCEGINDSIVGNEIVIFPNFNDTDKKLSPEKLITLKNALEPPNCYVVLHSSEKLSQRTILNELAPNFSDERLTIAAHSSSGIFGHEMLGKVPSLKTEEDWSKLIEKILDLFYDEKLEEYIKAVINNEDEAKNKLDDHIENL